ncbi:TipC family immunity protein [Streptococcus oralis]|uniref:TipC family immunity protein n=1 Tax=Streptococcus oralis TaxID=1303 RepID=A0AAW7W8M8_STROR|nr:TipC family immunity protein [Streptococcus oralis]MDO6344542.1 TipC family immunity protein [Streptococcus oralis]MDO6348371.1 TipC family immunity protein [Streptococcus oralis]MDO6350381.1 TipC family immunity protein [Streptococcus oralis]
MKKRKFAIFSLLIVLLLSFSGFQYYKYQRVHNIFDEIYYEESDYHNYTFLWKGRAFYKLKSLKFVDNYSQEISIHSIDYKSVDLPNTIQSLGYYFYFGFQEMTKVGIEMRLRLPDTETTINVDYLYDVNNQQLERFMWYHDEKSVRYYHQSQVEAFLTEHGKTADEIRREADEILRHKVLADWTSIYASRFSLDNWGEVTVKDIWRTE